MVKRDDKLLWENKWLQVRELDDWYTYIKHPANGVVVMPYDTEGYIWVRQEHCPPHVSGPGAFILTSLTGTIDEGHSPLETAAIELNEEAGFEADLNEFLDLGWVFSSKFSDYRRYLYAVDVTGKERGEITGDGSKGEVGATSIRIPVSKAMDLHERSYPTCLIRLFQVYNIDLLKFLR